MGMHIMCLDLDLDLDCVLLYLPEISYVLLYCHGDGGLCILMCTCLGFHAYCWNFYLSRHLPAAAV